MKILLFGSNGFVGNSLSKFLENEVMIFSKATLISKVKIPIIMFVMLLISKKFQIS